MGIKLVHVQVLALPQRLVGQDLGSATDDGGGGVNGGVASDHADVLRPEQAHQLEELLADQGLKRGRVVGAGVAGEFAYSYRLVGEHHV